MKQQREQHNPSRPKPQDEDERNEELQNFGPAAEDLLAEDPSADGASDRNTTGPGGFSSDPADSQDLSVVGPEDIGAGSGLDEAELARKKPLDGKPWDGDPDEPDGAS